MNYIFFFSILVDSVFRGLGEARVLSIVEDRGVDNDAKLQEKQNIYIFFAYKTNIF